MPPFFHSAAIPEVYATLRCRGVGRGGLLDTNLFAASADFVVAAGPAAAAGAAHATCCMLLPHCHRHFNIIFMQSCNIRCGKPL